MGRTIVELRTARASAGEEYAAAARAYATAWIELHAHDLALNNSNVIGRQSPPCAQFVSRDDVHLSVHPDFLPDGGPFLQRNLNDAAIKRHEEILAELA